MRTFHLRAALLFAAISVAITALAACVGEDPDLAASDVAPDPGTDSGSGAVDSGDSDPSPDSGGTELAWIGSWSINSLAMTDVQSTCLKRSDDRAVLR